MKGITLQFSTTSSLLSRLVRLATWSTYSHVDYVIFDDELTKTKEGYSLLGAQGDGVKIRPANYEHFTCYERVILTVTDEQYDKFIAFLTVQIGKKYDYTALFGILFHRDWQETDSWFCSELQAAALVYAGILSFKLKGNRVTPELLRVLVSVIETSETEVKE